MNAAQTCSISITDQPESVTPIETFTDSGGGGRRVYVAGSSTPLGPDATYYASADCGTFSGTAQFTTPLAKPSVSRWIAVPVTLPPAWNGSEVEIQYGETPQLGNTVTAPCSATCAISLPAMSDSIVCVRRIFRNGDSQVVARSSIQPIAVH